MTTYTTAAEAIERSISHDEIAYCEHTTENLESLMVECDDSVENGEVIEFWGEDDGQDWRVHVRTHE
jgi:hypothetical protein